MSSLVPQIWETREAGYAAQAQSDRQVRFEIIRLDENRPIGMTTLQVDHYVRTAEFVIMLAPEARGQRFAAEATLLTLDWAFHLAALRMVWLKVLEPNTAGIRAYRHAGFNAAGRLRAGGYWLGQPCDEILVDSLPRDFPGPSRIG